MKQAFTESLELLNQQHDEQIKNASPECQKADAEIRAISNDEDQTMAEQNKKILVRIYLYKFNKQWFQQVYQAQTPEVRKELDQYAIYKRSDSSSSSSSGF